MLDSLQAPCQEFEEKFREIHEKSFSEGTEATESCVVPSKRVTRIKMSYVRAFAGDLMCP